MTQPSLLSGLSAPPVPAMQALRGETAVAWAALDADWYLAAYPPVRDAIDEVGAEAVLYFYLQQGRRLGHSPNMFFDEAWYVRAYPDAAAAIRRGEAASGFDHYCRVGFRDRSPHWLFDEAFYRGNYSELTDEVLQGAGLVNGYDHYLRHGAREKRIGHWLFDPTIYCGHLDAEAAQEAEVIGAFRHYLDRVAAGRPELPTTLYFDPVWYRGRYPETAEAIAAGQWQSALHHYLGNDAPTDFDPLPEFSESYYLDRDAETAAAVAAGRLRNGYRHFLDRGRFALKAPSPDVDLRYYARLSAVRADLRQGRAPDPFTHYLAIGRAQDLPPAPPSDDRVSELQGQALFRRKAEHFLPLFARAPMSFASVETPELSVVMPAHNRLATTLTSLASLRYAYPGQIELILIDAGGNLETGQIERFVDGAWLLRLGVELGPTRSRNAGLHNAGAEAVLFLGSEVELAPGAVAAALRRLRSDPAIGAVGAKVIAADGRLREAGSIITKDGTAVAYCAGGSPLTPEANFTRTVDFCSSSFLLARAALLSDLDGFNADFVTPRYTDADLGARIASAGFRVVYDPAITVHDYAPDEPDEIATEADRNAFAEKHVEWLAARADAETTAEVFTRTPECHRRVLFVESMVPSRMLGSGFVRSNDIVQSIASLGWAVTVFPLRECAFDLASLYRDIPDTVEIMHDHTIDDLANLLADRAGYYDLIWVSRTHNLDEISVILDGIGGGGRRPHIILDTEAISAVRDAQRVKLSDGESSFDFGVALAREFASARRCHGIVAVNPDEAEQLRGLGHHNVKIVGHTRVVTPTPRPFVEREGLLFVGAIRELGSPNYDGLSWFVDSVLPLVEAQLGWETRLTVAGDLGDNVTLDRFRENQRVTLRGMVPDLEPLYDSHRLFIAPTRYGAGLPYKLYEAASFGLPVVATDLLCRQMGWENGRDLVAVSHHDPVGFAETIVALYRSRVRWQGLRDNALARLRAENNADDYAEAVRAVLDAAAAAPRLRLAAASD